MVEPTESEPKAELDRFIDAMIAIRAEIRAVEEGRLEREDNPLRNAPHTAAMACADDWAHAYARELAAYPLPALRAGKYWPPVGAPTTSTATATWSAPARPWRITSRSGARREARIAHAGGATVGHV